MKVTNKGKSLEYDEFTVRIPKALTKQTSKQKTLNGIILYLQPVYKNKKMEQMALVGHTHCSPSTCDVMVESCSACKVNATKGAEKLIEKDEISRKADEAGILLPDSGLLTP